jgi:hypothetical protein
MNKRLIHIQFVGILLILVALLGIFTSASRHQKAVAMQQTAASSKEGRQAEDADKKVIVPCTGFLYSFWAHFF